MSGGAMSYIVSAVESIAAHLHPGLLICLESTTYPGTTDELVQPMLEAKGMKAGTDFFLAFSPERVDPGNPTFHTGNVPKVVGGVTEDCQKLAAALYGSAITTIVPVSSTRVAEMVKLLENTFRAVNIALVNELALMCDRMNIDVWEVVDAARTKPFGFMIISVVIATRDRAPLLKATLNALCELQSPGCPFEILVVDNGSVDSTATVVAEVARRSSVPVTYLTEEKPGKSHALNTAIGHARGELLAFTDDDVLPSPGWLAAFAQAFSETDADYAAGRILPLWEAPPPRWLTPSLYGVLAVSDGGTRRLTLNGNHDQVMCGILIPQSVHAIAIPTA